MPVCSTTHLYHYMLGGETHLDSILAGGLQPASAFPESERWKQTESLYRNLYAALMEPVLKRPFTNSGVFLSPVDFRAIPGHKMARLGRIAVPVGAIEPAEAAISWVQDEQRVVLPFSPQALQEAAAIWPAEMVEAWFGKNPNMLFFYVPQVATFQTGGIPVRPEWVESAPVTPS